MERMKMNGYGKQILYMVILLAMMVVMLPSKSLAASNSSSYTVEFTYGEKQYVMNGDTTVHLSNILDHIGLTGEVSSVNVSDSSLFSASRVNGEWTVTAHQAFHTDEWMKVTIDGTNYEVKVTDVETKTFSFTLSGVSNITHNIQEGTYSKDTKIVINGINNNTTPTSLTTVIKFYDAKRNRYTPAVTYSNSTSGGVAEFYPGQAGWLRFNSDNVSNCTFTLDSLPSDVSQWKIENISTVAYNSGGGPSFDVVAVGEPSTNPTLTNTTAIYDGNAHSIGTSGGTGGTVKYATSNDNSTWSDWTTTVPSRTDTGTTYVKAKVVGDNFHTDSTETTVYTITVNSHATAPTLTGWSGTYNGIAHSVTATGASGGTVYYRTSENNSTWGAWSTTVPSRTDYGTTYVQAYTKGDSSHSDSAVTTSVAITVNKASLTITAKVQTITYGGSIATGTGQVTTATLASGDSLTAITLTPSTSNATTNGKITPSAATVKKSNTDVTNNYNITYSTGKLTINKATLTVTANNNSITYGDVPANNGVTYSGFVNGQNASALGGTLSYSYTYAQYGDVGNAYKITPSGLTSNNYTITFNTGTLTVNKKEVGLNWANTSLTYNGSQQIPTATATELVNNDSIGVTVTGAQTNAGSYTATASGLTGNKAGNYKLPTANTHSFSIATASMTVSASGYSETYDKAAHGIIVTAPEGATVKYRTASSGDYNLTTNPTFTNAVTYTVYYQVTKPNYTTVTGSETVVINKKPVDLSWDEDTRAYIYDGASHKPSAKIIGVFEGDECGVIVSGEQTDYNASAYTATASLTGEQNNNYVLPEAHTTTFTIAKRPVKVTANSQTVKLKGDISRTTADAVLAGAVDGHELTSITFGAVDTTSTTTVGNEIAIVPQDAEIKNGSTDVTDNYDITYVNGALTVEKKVPTYTTPSANTLTYNGGKQVLIKAGTSEDDTVMWYCLGDGEWTSDYEAIATTHADTYTIYYKVVGNSNFEDVFSDDNPGSLTVTIAKKDITISDIGVNTKTYDGNTTSILDYDNVIFGGIEAGDSLTVTAVGTFEDANAGENKNVAISDITLGGTSINDYKLATTGQQVTATATINKKEVGLEWHVGDTIYDGVDNIPTFTFNGKAQKPSAIAKELIAGDTCSVTVSGEMTNVGSSYTATAASLGNANYKLPAANTIPFKIIPRTIVSSDIAFGHDEGLEAGNYEYTGDVITPEITVSTVLEGDTAATNLVLDTDYVMSRETTATSTGTHYIKFEGQGNYDGIVYMTWEIVAKTITVTAQNKTKVYGDADPELTVDIDGPEDAVDQIEYEVTRAGENEDLGENVGDHAIVVTGDATQGDYNVVFVNGTLTITKAPVTVKAKNMSKTYGDDDPQEYTTTITGLKRNDDRSVITYTISRSNGENAGYYTITPTGITSQGNYSVTYNTGTFKINKRKLSTDFVGLDKVSFKADGENYSPQVVFSKYTPVRQDTDYKVSGETTANDAGVHTITVTGIGTNFSGSIALPWYITGVGDSKVTYDGQAHTIAVGGTDTMFKQEKTDTDYTLETPPEYTNVGSYTIYYKTTVDNPMYGYISGAQEKLHIEGTAVLTIEPKPVTVTAENKSKIRGEAEPDYTWNVDGLIAPDTANILTVSIGRASNDNDNVGEHAIIPSGDEVQGNYAVTYVNGILTISAKSANSEDITVVQDELETLTYTGSLLKPTIIIKDGDDTLTEDTDGEGEQIGDYTITYKGVAPTVYDNSPTPPTNAGTYKAVITFKDNYEGTREIEYSVAKAIPTITTNPTPAEITYGHTLADSILTGGVGSVEGTFAWEDSTINPSVSDSNTTEYTVVFTPEDSFNYESTTVAITIIVNKATTDKSALVDDNNKPSAISDIQYNNDEQPLITEPVSLPTGFIKVQYRLSNTNEWSDDIPTGKDVGDYTVQVKYIGDGNHNDLVADPISVSVSKKAVTVKADDISKSYGDADPELTATVTGTLGNDTVIYTVSRAAGEAIGTYTVTPSGAAVQGNYVVTYETGVFEVLGKSANSESITVAQVENETLVYDGTTNKPTITVKDGETVLDEDTDWDGVDDGVYSITYEGVEPTVYPESGGDATLPPTNAGTYEAVIVFKTPYTGTRRVVFEIGKKALTITADAKSKTYGEADPALTYTVSGLVTGDTEESVVTGALSRAEGQNAGTYAITKGTLSAGDNYDISYAEANLTIEKKTLAVTADDMTKTYGNADPAFTYTADGFAYEDSIATVMSGALSRAEGSDVGTYAITQGTLSAGDNYDISYTGATLTVTKRNVTLTSVTASKAYDGTALTNAEITVSGDGFADGEGAEYNVTGTQTLPGNSVNGFTYTLKTGTNADNYTITKSEGTLTVTGRTDEGADKKYEINVEANSYEVTYDGTEHTVNGLVTDEFTINGVTYTVSGLSATASGTDAGDYVSQITGTAVVKDQADNVLTDQFIVNTTDGSLKINKRNVTLTSATDSKTYDGTALTNDEIVVSGDGFVAGSETVAAEGATYSVTGSQKVVGSSANSFTYTLNTGTKADNYNITTVAGTLTVTSRDAKYEISPQANSGEVKYDGKEHQVSGFVTDTFVVEGNTYKVSGLIASVKGTDAGTYTVSVTGTAVVKDSDGVDVSDEFSVTPQTGTLTITKRSVTMTSSTDSKEYDGDALTNDTVNVRGDGFVTGEGAEYTVTGTRTVTGTSENGFTYTLNTNTKADNYDITTSYGTLTVTNRNTKYNVTLKADSNTEKYDGIPKTVTTYTIDGKAGDTFTASNGKTYTISGMKAEATGTDAGTYTVNVTGTPTIKDSANEDVTAQFAVSVESGTLTINKRSVTLTSDTASKAYDGKVLKAEKVTVSGDGFVEGESTSYTFTGSQTLPGESDNTFTYALVGAKADNYNITTVNGKLTVNERNGEGDDGKYKITVKAKSGTFTYDGNVHTVTGFETLEFTVGGVTYTVSGISSTGSLTDAGETEVVITGTPKVTDADGNDLTGNFDVECENGKLTVVKATQEKPEDLSFRKASSDTSKDGVITGLDEKKLYEYSEDDGTTWTKVKEGSTEVTGIGAGDVIIRYQENNNKMPSDTIKIVIETKEDQIAPSKDGIEITNASGEDQTDGVIKGVDDTMEYSLDAGNNWTPVEENQTEIDNLPVGDIEIRLKGDEDKNPGESLKVSIGVTSRTQGFVNFKTDDSTTPVETSVESAQSSNIEDYAQTQVEEGKDVKIELEITPRKEEDVEETSITEITKVSSEVFASIEAENIETEYLEIDLAKYVDNTKEGNISDTETPLEIELNYDSSKIGTPIVIRTHKGKAKVFEKLSKKPNDKFVDATYYVDNGKIYLYSQFFSDFALVYATKKTYYVSIDTGVGDPIVQIVGEDSTIELPTDLTKEGYGFGGWYKDSEYLSAWDSEKDRVNEDTHIYGKWDKKVTGVSVSVDTVNLTKTGETSQITVTVSPSDSANKKVTYKSSNTKVATVDANGKITAVANGTATITVTTADGSKTATVKVTVAIPEISKQGTEGTVTAAQVEKNSLAMNEGLKIDQKGSKIKISWGKVKDADGYEVYVAYCGTNFNKKKPAKTIKNNETLSVTITKINGKKLNLKKNYKLYVIAYKLVDGNKVTLAKTITGHIVGRKNVAFTNVKAIKLTKSKYTIKVGKTAKIKAKTILVDKTKKQLSNAHATEFRYASSDKKIAIVNKKGKIKGIKAGTCTIYVYARNGYAKKIKVTVK